MQLWRIEAEEFIPTALEGIGAELFGGRWNQKGTAMVYFSSHLSLAMHEKFVHVEPSARFRALRAFGIEVPDAVVAQGQRPKKLPPRWNAPTADDPAMKWGSDWVASNTSLLAFVPSMILPLQLYEEEREFNVLINSRHADLDQIKVVADLPFGFDPRAWKAPRVVTSPPVKGKTKKAK